MRMIRTLAVGAASLSLAFTLASCGSTKPTVEEVKPEDQATEVVEETKDEQTETEATTDTSTATDDTATTDDGQSTPELEEVPAITATKDMQRIGSDEYGYMSVPADWVKFVDIDGNNSIQYCDTSRSYIVSLNVFDLTNVPEEERASFGAYEAATSVWYNIEDGGGQDVAGATVTLAGQTAYQVYAYYPDDDSYLVTWSLADEAGAIHYVAAEGPAENIMEVVQLVEDTYSFTE